MALESPDADYCSDVQLSTGAVVGLSFTTQSGSLSAAAVVGVLGVITIRYIKRIRNKANRSWKLVRTNIDGLMLNLLIADLFMSFGAILDAKWANLGRVHCGGYCNAQGAIQLVGETSVALFTLAITVLSFISIRIRPIECRVVVWGGISVFVWLFVLLWAILGYTTHLGDRKDSFYTPTPYWCWISPQYKIERIAGEYIWLWIAGFGSILLYTPLFFMLRGGIARDSEIGWRSALRWKRRALEPETEEDDKRSVASSRADVSPFALLWYPLSYTLCVLPLSVVRWITFGHEGPPSSDTVTTTFVTVFIFNLSGLANVVLLLFTRAGTLLLDSEPDEGNQVRQEKHPASPSPSPGASFRQETGFGGPSLTTRDRDFDFDNGRVNRTGLQQKGFGGDSSGSDLGTHK